MSLTQELTALRNQAAERIPPEIRTVMIEATKSLSASGIAAQAVGEGATAPDFTLPSARGGDVTLSALLADGPVVLVFYRGGWCPYCNLELRAYQRELEAFTAKGATLVAVSPQTPDNSLSSAEKNELSFDVLSDVGQAVAERFGLVFELPEQLQEIYGNFGISLPETNGESGWRLPIAATYLIGQDGTVALANVDVDYSTRLDPLDVLAKLDDLPSAAAA